MNKRKHKNGTMVPAIGCTGSQADLVNRGFLPEDWEYFSKITAKDPRLHQYNKALQEQEEFDKKEAGDA